MEFSERILGVWGLISWWLFVVSGVGFFSLFCCLFVVKGRCFRRGGVVCLLVFVCVFAVDAGVVSGVLLLAGGNKGQCN